MKKINLNDAFPPVDEGFERGMSRAFEAIGKEKVMKHKMKFTLLAAALVILALAGTAVAAGVSVISYFAGRDARLEAIAPDSAAQDGAGAHIESEELGESSIRFDSAWFDGENLVVGYVMGNTERMEAFTPTDEQLSALEKEDDPSMPQAFTEEDEAILAAFNEAVERGEPFGFVAYSVYPSDHISTDDGIEIGPESGDEALTDDGLCLVILEMETPLPEELRGRDSLELHMPVWRQTTWRWFDGESFYEGSERSRAGEAVVTVGRSEADVRTLTGQGEYRGATVTVSARSSILRAAIDIEAAEEVFAEDPEVWYDCIVRDERDRTLRVNSVERLSPKHLSVSLFGEGAVPERLSVYILALTEEEWEEWDEEKLMQSVEPIVLKPQG